MSGVKVYLSSTYSDLADYRESVYDSLRKIRHDVVSMEDYAAGDQRPLDKCLQDVAESDVYVGLFAWRYGYVPKHGNAAGKSITELEFRKAVEMGKPCLIFLLDESAPWVIGNTDFFTGESGGGESIRKLREELRERYVVGFFSTPEEAANEVMAAIVRAAFTEQVQKDARIAVTSAAPPKPHYRARAGPRDGFPKLWTPGDVIRARFLDGAEEVHRRVARTAAMWDRHVNLSFEFGDDPDAEIRISFASAGTWSYPGTDCLGVGSDEPTMNYGWLAADTPSAEVRRTVLHEFGHVLGMLHEHQNPARPDYWDKDKVYRSYEGAPNFWSRQQVDELVFKTWDPELFPFAKEFDPESIMVFPIPKELTIGDFEIGWNMDLSAGDIDFASKLYPF